MGYAKPTEQEGSLRRMDHLPLDRAPELPRVKRHASGTGHQWEVRRGTREAYLARYYPEIDDNNWREQCGEIATQTNFADYSRARRLELIQQQEAVDHGETQCPMFTWTWSDAVEGPLACYPSSSPSLAARYLFRGPYDPDSVWNLTDNAVTFKEEACLLSLLDIGSAEVHEHRGPGPLQVPDDPGPLDHQTAGDEMPGIVHRADRCTAQRPQGNRKEEEEGPQEKRGDEVRARRGKVGPREGGLEPRIRATGILRAAGGIERRQDRTGSPTR